MITWLKRFKIVYHERSKEAFAEDEFNSDI